jgi:SNF2 family DNA or RNA helicase
MVIYDLDGSDTDPEIELPGVGPSNLSAATDVKRQNAPQHRTNRQVDHSLGDSPETRSSTSLTREAVEFAEYGTTGPSRKRPKPIAAEPERLQWSDDGSTNDGEAVYKEFKARKSKARKHAIRSAKRAQAIAAENAPKSARVHGGTGVGKQTKRKSKTRKEKSYEDVSSDDDLMEWTMPDYLKERRARFDQRVEHLRHGGLSLPPVYDDLYFSDDDQLEHLKERPDFPLLKPCAPYADIPLPYSLALIPAPIAQWLRDYQVKGAEFLHELFVYQRGGILGDDMGLGKTVQVVAFLAAAYGKTGDERDKKRMRKSRKHSSDRWYPRTLIICPGTLMSNWQDELNRWGWWHVDIYHGSTAAKDTALSAALSGHIEIMITTYTTYRNCKGAINMVAWDCVVADECHLLKERKSETTQAMNEVNALCRIGLTGTAIQNKYEELWTLLNWTNPGRFGPISTWRASICEPLKLGQSHDATVYQLSRARKTAKKLVENLLPQFFLRRMKTLIKDQLPKKSDRVVFCPLTPTQASAYENYLDGEIVQLIKNSGDPCDCGSGKKAGWCCHTTLEDGTKWQVWVFPAITTLQKLSNHLAILIPQGTDPQDKQAKDLENLQIALPSDWESLYRNRDSIINYANPEFCGKWRILRKLLKFWHDEGGNKVLVFSHSVRLLKMLQVLFTNTAFTVAYLDGAMKYEDRYRVVTEFNTDPTQFVFLISTKAGGVGLNITSANKVVVVDPNWNPSYDLQAQDRAYRIGQTRDVEVFRLISQGTLEEIVYARQIYKQQQASIGYNATSERRYFAGVQDRKEQKGEIFGLTNLFAYQGESVVLRDIVNKLNISESRAGVRLASLEVDEEDDGEGAKAEQGEDVEDAAISQLAAEIIGDGDHPKSRKQVRAPLADGSSAPKKHDPIQAILSSAGVQYTHENSEVIGSSKVEAQLSKRAEQAADGDETRQGEAKVFFDEAPSPVYADGLASGSMYAGVCYKYRPPEDVKRRIFCSMAKWAGYKDPVEFALVVEGWTQANRRDFLTEFYRWRRDVLSKTADGRAKGDAMVEDDETESRNETKSESGEDDDEL